MEELEKQHRRLSSALLDAIHIPDASRVGGSD
jgi:hypothetical protein